MKADDPGRLIWQGRGLLVLMSLRYFLVGALALFSPQDFRADSLRTIVPIELWGVAALAAAGAAFAAAAVGRELPFRVMVVVSFFLTGAITALLFAAMVEDELAVPIAPIFGMVLSMQVTVLPLPERLPPPPED
jgi:hypothetical protein